MALERNNIPRDNRSGTYGGEDSRENDRAHEQNESDRDFANGSDSKGNAGLSSRSIGSSIRRTIDQGRGVGGNTATQKLHTMASDGRGSGTIPRGTEHRRDQLHEGNGSNSGDTQYAVRSGDRDTRLADVTSSTSSVPTGWDEGVTGEHRGGRTQSPNGRRDEPSDSEHEGTACNTEQLDVAEIEISSEEETVHDQGMVAGGDLRNGASGSGKERGTNLSGLSNSTDEQSKLSEENGSDGVEQVLQHGQENGGGIYVQRGNSGIKLNQELLKGVAQYFAFNGESLGIGTEAERFENNKNAIKTLKKIEEEQRWATPQEQEILSKYVGWGGLAKAFDEQEPKWASRKQN